MTVKNALLASSAGVGNPAAHATTKGKSKVEAEIERQNKPEVVAPRAGCARVPHGHRHRHGDRGGDADSDGDDDGETLADDILRGAAQIGAFLGLSPRQAFHFLQIGAVPATKEGNVWVSTKSRLRKHYNESRYEPPAGAPAEVA
jgi:hypothetical protein